MAVAAIDALAFGFGRGKGCQDRIIGFFFACIKISKDILKILKTPYAGKDGDDAGAVKGIAYALISAQSCFEG